MLEIIQNSNLSEKDKRFFETMFAGLKKHQEDILFQVSENVSRQLETHGEVNDGFCITTVLIDKGKLSYVKNCNLYEIYRIKSIDESLKVKALEFFVEDRMADLDDDVEPYVGFLKCSYSDRYKYLDKKYVGTIKNSKGAIVPMSYTLRHFDGFLLAEQDIFAVADQYRVSRPVIFSPYSRKAVYVDIDIDWTQFGRSEVLEVNFDFKGNHLDEVLLTGKTLVWNAQIVNGPDVYGREVTDKGKLALYDDVFRLYEFKIKPGEYFCVKNDVREIKRFSDHVHVNTLFAQGRDELDCCKISLETIPEMIFGETECYSNEVFTKGEAKIRICSEGDVEYLIHQYLPAQIEYLGCGFSRENGKDIIIYEDADRYPYIAGQIRGERNHCYLRFAKSEDMLFEDRINYLISYLNYFYPEFYWVGIV